jgi:glucose-1-phosphate adenylyltransferase
MGIYVFSARFLYERLCDDAAMSESRHDFGGDIIPRAISDARVFAFPFLDENRKGDAYWRDVGTLDAYYQASLDLVEVDPQLNLYDQSWPIRSYQPNLPPPKFVFSGQDDARRRGEALDSIVCQGAILSGGCARRCVLGPNVRINSYAEIEGSILFEGVDVGRHCRIRNAIIDKGVHIPAGAEIGYDPAEDRRRGWTTTESGLVVIARGESV